MPRFLLALALLALPLPIAAQSTYGSMTGDAYGYELRAPSFSYRLDAPPKGNPLGQWTADLNPGRKYPVFVRLQPENFNYDGVNYFGTASAHIYDFAHAGENLDFHYNCGAGFLPGEYYARWEKSARKLEIRIRKPGTNETRSCKMKILAATTPPSQP